MKAKLLWTRFHLLQDGPVGATLSLRQYLHGPRAVEAVVDMLCSRTQRAAAVKVEKRSIGRNGL